MSNTNLTERDVTKATVKYLDTLRLFHCRWNAGHSGHIRTRKGIPDRVVCYRGLFLALEFKGPRGKLRREQEEVCGEIKAASGHFFVIRSVQDVKDALAVVDQDIEARWRRYAERP